MRVADTVPNATLAELLMSAATALTEGPGGASLAPVGLPVRRGRLSLGRLRAAFGPGACPTVDVVAGFGNAVWLGRPGSEAPEMGRLVWRATAALDHRGRVVLDRRARLYLGVADPAAFVVAALRLAAGLLLVPVDGYDQRVGALS